MPWKSRWRGERDGEEVAEGAEGASSLTHNNHILVAGNRLKGRRLARYLATVTAGRLQCNMFQDNYAVRGVAELYGWERERERCMNILNSNRQSSNLHPHRHRATEKSVLAVCRAAHNGKTRSRPCTIWPSTRTHRPDRTCSRVRHPRASLCVSVCEPRSLTVPHKDLE